MFEQDVDLEIFLIAGLDPEAVQEQRCVRVVRIAAVSPGKRLFVRSRTFCSKSRFSTVLYRISVVADDMHEQIIGDFDKVAEPYHRLQRLLRSCYRHHRQSAPTNATCVNRFISLALRSIFYALPVYQRLTAHSKGTPGFYSIQNQASGRDGRSSLVIIQAACAGGARARDVFLSECLPLIFTRSGLYLLSSLSVNDDRRLLLPLPGGEGEETVNKVRQTGSDLRSAPGSGLLPSARRFWRHRTGRRARGVTVRQLRQVFVALTRNRNVPRHADVKVGIEGPLPEPPNFVDLGLVKLARDPRVYPAQRPSRAGGFSPWPRYTYQPVISCPFSGKTRSPTGITSVPGLE